MGMRLLAGVGLLAALATTAEARPVLGVLAVPVQDPVVRAQLQLPDGQGLLVEEVAPDSAAEAAGMQRFDILLSANDQPLATSQDLRRVVAREPVEPIRFTYLRGGQQATLEVTPLMAEPDQRPRGRLGHLAPWRPEAGGWTEGFNPFVEQDLPPGMTIRVEKSGSDPTQVVVEQSDPEGGEPVVHSATLDDLASLPQEVQGHVRGFLRQGLLARSGWPIPMPGPGGLPPERLDELRQQMQEQFEAIRREMDTLRRGSDPAADDAS